MQRRRKAERRMTTVVPVSPSTRAMSLRCQALSVSLLTSVDMVARGKLTANAGPMPAALAIVDQAHQVQRHATKTAFSEYKRHRIPFELSSKRSGSSSHDIYLWFSSPVRL